EKNEDAPGLIVPTAIVSLLDLLGKNDALQLSWLLGSVPVINLAAPPIINLVAIGPILLDWNNKLDQFNRAVVHIPQGAPTFARVQAPTDSQRNEGHGLGVTGGWPNFWTRTHEQMHISWLRRAHQGGLRLLIAHASNTDLFGDMVGNRQNIQDVLPRQL